MAEITSSGSSEPARNRMTLWDYQQFTKTTSLYKDVDSLFLGLCEEAGEVAGKRKKLNRGDYNTVFIGGGLPDRNIGLTPEGVVIHTRELAKELGDVLWYVSEICNTHGLTLQEVIETNVAKLTDRKERGVIQGSGDFR